MSEKRTGRQTILRLAMMLGVLMILVSLPMAAHAAETPIANKNLRGAVRTTKTYIYKKNSSKSEQLVPLPYGYKVDIVSETPLWYGVVRGDVRGYVKKEKLVVYDRTKKHLALTFDDGPSTSTTPTVLNAMEKYKAHCTFFVLGERINDNTGKIMKRAVSLGCEIGSHSYDHPQLTKLSSSSIKSQFSRTDTLVEKYIGTKCAIARTPYGAKNATVLSAMAKPNIFWSVDTLDWKYRDTSRLISYVNNHASDGAIILMHDIHSTTVKAVDSICKNLTAKNYELMTVSELAAIKSVKLTKGTTYSKLTYKMR